MNKIILLLLGVPFLVYGAYEKPALWSAKWSSLGGTFVVADGSDAAAFNPAGLVNGGNEGSKAELGINLSPVLSKFKGPIVQNNTQEEGENVFSPSGGFVYQRDMSSKVSIGVGVYGAGGNTAKYEDLDFTVLDADLTKKGVNETDLKLIEASLGMGYKMNKNFSLGLSWRISHAKAKFLSASGSAAAVAHIAYEDLTDTNFTGFRLGAQYLSDDKSWGLGFAYRSQLNLELEGDVSGQLQLGANGAVSNITNPGKVTAQSRFPMQASLGGFKKWKKLKTYFQVDWTQYSVNERIKFDGDVNGTFTNTPVIQDNDDMYSFKVGLECGCDKGWTWRLGYALSTQVTPNNAARATLASPGTGHLLAVGAGKRFSDKWLLDFALERAWRGGDVDGNEPSNSGVAAGTNTAPKKGEYESAGYSAHISAKYSF